MNEAPTTTAAKAPRRKNVVSIEAPEALAGIAGLLGETPEQFVHKATTERLAALSAKAQAAVAGQA